LRSISAGDNLVTFDMIAALTLLEKAEGKPAELAFPSLDPMPIWAQGAAIFKDAPHPNAAKLFLTWFLENEQQAKFTGNWSQLDMTTRLGASATGASLALAAFWAMVTAGRVLFAAIGRWLPERVTYRILPFVLVGTFLLTGALSRPHAAAGIAVFALAGLGCSALLPLTISFGEQDLAAMSAAMAGAVIAFYQVGYGIAAFGVGPLADSGVSLSKIFAFTALIAAAMALLSFFVTGRPAPAETATGPDSSLPVSTSADAGPG
jgi:hypothetical protein